MRSRLVGGLALVTSVIIGVVSAQSTGQTVAGQPIYKPGAGVTFPTMLESAQPVYPDEAQRARITGAVELEAVIMADGTVGDVRIRRSLDVVFGLDMQAVAALRKWRFRPGTYEGRPVPTVVTVIMEFGLSQPRVEELAKPPAPRGGRVEDLTDDFLVGTYPLKTPGLVPPKVIKYGQQPKYTANAMRAKIQGTVEIDLVVMEDGSIGRARITRSLDTTYGLDDEALRAARTYTFTPATLNGKPVPVAVQIVQEFRLH